MGCDLNYDNIDLIQKLYEFGREYKKQFHVDGYRFDAVKHIRPRGTLDFLREMRRTNNGKGLFAVAEFLHDDCDLLLNYICKTNGELSLFDVPLQRKMVMASSQGNRFDMGSIFNYTLTSKCPTLAVTYVHSHDDQPAMSQDHSSRGSYVGDWFISQAYALILLRDVGYPVVSDVDTIRHSDMIKRYMLLRTNCTYGSRTDRFDHSNTVGWSFTGDNGFDNSMAVVITNGDYGKKWLYTGKPHITYRDFTGALSCVVTTNRDGWGEFECPSGNTSAWVEDSKFYSLNAGINA